MKTRTLQLLTVSAIYFSLHPALAAELAGGSAGGTTTTGTTAGIATAATAPVPARRIASRFEGLAGSPENAASLVAGLRSGSVITLGATDTAGGISFTPATGQMGYGNVTRALTLAQRQLAAQGIAEPTPEQLRIALNGGTVTGIDSSGASRSVEMPGVLQLRSQGMGWGQVAHQLGVSPGNRPQPATTTTPSAQAGVDLRSSSHGQGAIVSGDGSILHGRAPGYGGGAGGSAQAKARAPAQASVAAHAQGGRPSFVAARTSLGSGNPGKASVQVRGNGRL